MMFSYASATTKSKVLIEIQRKHYATNIPDLAIRWFYSTDIPVSKPKEFNYKQTERAKKFVPFAKVDSEKLETAYQKLKKSLETDDKNKASEVVPVNEDYLFDCDLDKMEMRPAYWDGPVYEIRRGSWFLNKNPLSEKIANQLEESYQRLKPCTRFEPDDGFQDENIEPLISEIKSEVNIYEKENATKWPYDQIDEFDKVDKLAVFKDDRTAFLVDKNSTLGKLQIENFYKLPAKQVLGADTVTRGYVKSSNKEYENKNSDIHENKDNNSSSKDPNSNAESDFIGSLLNNFRKSEESNQRFQKDLEGDYSNHPKYTSNRGDRKVDHLIFGVHGIGQSLSSKFSGVNFAHDCNSMRKLMKTVFQKYSKYSDIAYEGEDASEAEKTNCKTQILPIVWRYNIDFSLDSTFEEYDDDGTLRLPSLSQINIEAITPLRHIAGDVVMDILLYYEPKYNEQILTSVIRSANELYDKYLKRHPNFDGKVSFIGHSLGSVIALDILSQQPDEVPAGEDFDPNRHLKFKVENFFGAGSPNGVFKLIRRQNIRPRSLYPLKLGDELKVYERPIQSPNVRNYYNVFYPTDPVAYRIEPLVHTSLSKYQPKVIPFSDENGLNNQLKILSNMPTELLNNSFVKSLIDYSGLGESNKERTKKNNENPSSQDREVSMALDDKVVDMLFELNKTGRVDYSLPKGYFDIDILSAIGSHTQYFDDPNFAAFLLSQLWLKGSDKSDLKGVQMKPDSNTPV